jgi:2-methylisocitrate lyase-like PEP mutase family enzyme
MDRLRVTGMGQDQVSSLSGGRMAACTPRTADKRREHIAAAVAAVAPKPLNLLVGCSSDLTLGDIAERGMRRVGLGVASARSAWRGYVRAVQPMATAWRFDGFTDAWSGGELNGCFAAEWNRRSGA